MTVPAQIHRWDKLSAQYLPLTSDEGKWRYSREVGEGESDQGWKLHVSATILNACDVIEAIAPALRESGVLFKAPVSLVFLGEINGGIRHGYSQVGKAFTIYPRTDDEALELAERLDELTRDFRAPEVPFDRRYGPKSNVYYRYGAFRRIEGETLNNEPTSLIVNDRGEFVADRRDIAVPEWIADIFGSFAPTPHPKSETPLSTSYHIFGALRQRGKGGVYEAVDITQIPPRICIVKEGRRYGEVGWDGSDGRSMVENEAKILSALNSTEIGVPKVFDWFETGGNFYLVEEKIEGESLQKLLSKRRRRLDFATIAECAAALSRLIEAIHRAGFVWRDCKPGNLMIGPNGEFRPIDFEGAAPVGSDEIASWRTTGFSTPQNRENNAPASFEDDIFSFGAVLYFLITGRIHDIDSPVPAEKHRRGIPPVFRQLLDNCLSLERTSALLNGGLSRRCGEIVAIIGASSGSRSAERPRTGDPGENRPKSRRAAAQAVPGNVLRTRT
jgi:predicted Ser/Thr protein kinase